MRTGIFYFSATGNSLYTASEIKKEFKDAKLISIPQALSDREYLYEFDEVGFVFPVYYGGLPKLVEKFISNIELPRVRYLFAIGTKSKKVSYNVLVHMNCLLKDLNYELNYGVELVMVNNYLRRHTWDGFGEKEITLNRANHRLKEIIVDVKRLEDNGPFKKSINGSLCEIGYRSWEKKLNRIDQKFTTSGTCMDCRICESVCPVNNILVVDENPKWLGKCEDCMACIQICPSNNIQISELALKKKRYLHPKVDIKDIMDSNR